MVEPSRPRYRSSPLKRGAIPPGVPILSHLPQRSHVIFPRWILPAGAATAELSRLSGRLFLARQGRGSWGEADSVTSRVVGRSNS